MYAEINGNEMNDNWFDHLNDNTVEHAIKYLSSLDSSATLKASILRESMFVVTVKSYLDLPNDNLKRNISSDIDQLTAEIDKLSNSLDKLSRNLKVI